MPSRAASKRRLGREVRTRPAEFRTRDGVKYYLYLVGLLAFQSRRRRRDVGQGCRAQSVLVFIHPTLAVSNHPPVIIRLVVAKCAGTQSILGRYHTTYYDFSDSIHHARSLYSCSDADTRVFSRLALFPHHTLKDHTRLCFAQSPDRHGDNGLISPLSSPRGIRFYRSTILPNHRLFTHPPTEIKCLNGQEVSACELRADVETPNCIVHVLYACQPREP